MNEFITSNRELLNLILEIVLLIVPFVITWYVRKYVKGTRAEKDLAAVVSLSNSAIDYVENLDKQGKLDELTLSPDFSKGVHKLKLASQWMGAELQRHDISITEDEAGQWIRAEFQRRVGDVEMVSDLNTLAETAVNTIRYLEEQGLITVPEQGDKWYFMLDLAADWLITQFALKNSGKLTYEEAQTWVRAAYMKSLSPASMLPAVTALPMVSLESLAQQAIQFLHEVKTAGRLKMDGESGDSDVDLNIATAWLLTEVAKRGLAVNTAQIATAVINAMKRS
ncbi:MAG: hypothetical protein DWQ04_18450 [Chloroflexi bacterium]|nr:MAG: hypothetical protein DWQ04_18450 [Chloroflexota bacterium]